MSLLLCLTQANLPNAGFYYTFSLVLFVLVGYLLHPFSSASQLPSSVAPKARLSPPEPLQKKSPPKQQNYRRAFLRMLRALQLSSSSLRLSVPVCRRTFTFTSTIMSEITHPTIKGKPQSPPSRLHRAECEPLGKDFRPRCHRHPTLTPPSHLIIIQIIQLDQLPAPASRTSTTQDT